MLTPPAHVRPAWLPLRLWLGSLGMACLFYQVQGGTVANTTRLLLGLPLGPDAPPESSLAGFSFERFGHSLLILSVAVLAATGAASSLCWTACRFLPALLPCLIAAGRALVAIPFAALLWSALAWWIGAEGRVIETLLPDLLGDPQSDQSQTERLARQLWTGLAPILALAVPLTGLLLDRLGSTLIPWAQAPRSQPVPGGSPASFPSRLKLGLLARGLSPGRLQARHLQPMVAASWQGQLEAALFWALPLLVVVEQILQFPGWGSAMAAALQAQHPAALATGLHTGGILLAVGSAMLGLVRPRGPQPGREPLPIQGPAVAFTHPRSRQAPTRLALLLTHGCLLAAGGALLLYPKSPLHSAFATLTSPAALAWQADALAVLRILAVSIPLALLLAALRLTRLGDWLRRYGALETLSWSPLALWTLAWSHATGRVIGVDACLTLTAAIALSIDLHAITRASRLAGHLEAARCLGATRWRAWRNHALLPWLHTLVQRWFVLAGSAWLLRVTVTAFFPPGLASAPSSLGTFLSTASLDALHDPAPILAAGLATALSVLSCWTLGRIISPSHEP